MQQQTEDRVVDLTPEDFPEKVLEASQEKPVQERAMKRVAVLLGRFVAGGAMS